MPVKELYIKQNTLNSISNENIFQKSIQLQDFITQKQPISPYYFRYFIEKNVTNLFMNYRSLLPNRNFTEYYNLLPYHANGIPKRDIDYRDLLKIDNLNIKHFSSFLNHGDKHEKETGPFLLKSSNGPTKIEETRKKKFTLIYGIGTCNPSPYLLREIKAFSHDDVAIIINIDNKANRTIFYDLFSQEKNNPKFENVYFIDSPRFLANWGQITQAFIQIVITQASLKYFPDSLYISFHSESDYPIVPNDCIINYLKKYYPNNYMITLDLPAYHFKRRKKDEYLLFFEYKDISNISNDDIIKMIKYLFPNKSIPKAEWKNGWNWYTMTLKDSKLMIEFLFKRFELIDTLEHVLNSDELIFQTLVAEAKINTINDYHRVIDWREHQASPLVFTEKYADEVINQKCNFWARKFKEGISDKVLDMIDRNIKNFDSKKFEIECYV